MKTLTIQRGNPFSVLVTITQGNSVYDLTGKTVLFTVKDIDDFADNDDSAKIKTDITVHTSATEGKTTISLTDKQTLINVGEYKCDVRVYDLGVKLNSETGFCNIVEIVTKRI